MTQRARLSQLKHTDETFRTFYEQFTRLEENTKHFRAPVAKVADLPTMGNNDGVECLVLDSNIKYRWNAGLQAWRPILGSGYEVPTGSIKRYRGKVTATDGQTIVSLDRRYDVGSDTLDVYIQGILQDVDVDYYEVDDMTIEFTTPLEAGMIVTYMTPYIVGDLANDADLQKRLESIEHNHYQLMLTQYYSGKPVNTVGLVFDGFLNTSYIDYANTSVNMSYDVAKRRIGVNTTLLSKFTEVFDANTEMAVATTITLRNGEGMLPTKTTYDVILNDGFDNVLGLADTTTAYYNDANRYMTTDKFETGGNSYPSGDFMNGPTGNPDRASIYNWGDSLCYSVLCENNIITAISDTHWHYTTVSNSYPVGYYRYTRANSAYGDDNLSEIYYMENQTSNRSYNCFVKSNARIYTLSQYNTGSYWYQVLYAFNGNSANLGNYMAPGRPSGLPSGLLENNAITSKSQITQMGSGVDFIVLRVADIFYFIDVATWACTRILDYTSQARKPSLYNVQSNQITCDSRYMYIPARLLRNGTWGYYLEAWDLIDGTLANEILVTTYNTGQPGTTAMHYNHYDQRMALGLNGGSFWTPNGKSVDSYNTTSYTGVIYFESAGNRSVNVDTVPFTTNLPVVNYRLTPTSTLNGGTIDYYIKFGSSAYTKINPGQDYTFTNPNKTADLTVQLRATMTPGSTATYSPRLDAWKLEIKGFVPSALYQSKPQAMNSQQVTGGRAMITQTVPLQTQALWSVQLDNDENPAPVSAEGYFTMNPHDAVNATLRCQLNTSNVLFSPILKDVVLQLYTVNQAKFESVVYEQVEDIRKARLWFTNSYRGDYVTPYLSRDGGTTWVAGEKDQTINMPDGTVEYDYNFVFTGNEVNRNQLKLRFMMNGPTEFLQYGVSINPF